MAIETLNQAVFAAMNESTASAGAIASLEALAVAPIWLLPPLLLGIWVLGDARDREAAVFAGLVASSALLIAHIASVTIDHPRPFAIGLAPNLLSHPADSSFPSDHTTTILALAFAFGRRPVSALPGLAWVLGAIGLAVGAARVALGLHYPLDVLGGAAIGAGAAVVVDVALRRPLGMIVTAGERIRGHVAPLARRDDRKVAEGADARPAR